MKVKVDKEACSGDAICVDICPEVFEMNEDDIAIVLVDTVPEEHEDAVREAADSCPESCIEIEE
ncbi:MAG: ferredoxin [candidate division Zixibacteria bacterium]|jgi:ferredoxin|nr:ferredoxin [candidate division Zixibacteria bacterium]